MKRRLPLLAFSSLAIATAAFAYYLADDEDELVLGTDITEHAPDAPLPSTNGYSELVALTKRKHAFLEYEGQFAPPSAEEPAAYRQKLATHAGAILENFKIASSEFDTLAKLAACEQIASTQTSYKDTLPGAKELRRLTLAMCAYCELAAVNDLPESGLDELLDLYCALRSWTPRTRTLVENMQCIGLLGQIFDSLQRAMPYLSHPELARLNATLADPIPFGTGLESALKCEYVLAATALDDAIAQSNPLLGHFSIQRNRTLNLYGRFYLDQFAHARRNEWEEMADATAALEHELSTIHLRNRGGWQFLALVVPHVTKAFQRAHSATDTQRDLVSAIQRQLAKQI